MGKKILVVQSRTNEIGIESERNNYRHSIGDVAEVDFLSAIDEKLAWTTPEEFLKGYDGLIFGGSAEFDFHGGRLEHDPARLMSMLILSRAKNIVSYARSKDIPTLGVCFGHQLIAEMYGGTVTNDASQKKVGSYDVRLTEAGKEDPLFGALPESFVAQYGHRDSVTSLPEGAIVLGASQGCRFSALRFGNKTYTTQFHVELTAADEIAALKRGKGYLPEGVSAESIVRESPEASKILPLWIERIVA